MAEHRHFSCVICTRRGYLGGALTVLSIWFIVEIIRGIL